MSFSGLVTMAWSDGLWLDEAFATFVALPRRRPGRIEALDNWRIARADALEVDRLYPPPRPWYASPDAQADPSMFDVLTYKKAHPPVVERPPGSRCSGAACART